MRTTSGPHLAHIWRLVDREKTDCDNGLQSIWEMKIFFSFYKGVVINIIHEKKIALKST